MSKEQKGGKVGGPMSAISTEKAKDFKGTMKKLMSYLLRYRIRLLIILILSIAGVVSSVISPKILGEATTEISKGLIGKITGTSAGIDFDKILQIVIVLLILYIVGSIFTYIESFIMEGISNQVSFNLRKSISEKMHKLPLRYFETKTTGEILSRITNDVDTLAQNLSQSSIQIIDAVFTLIGVTIMMLTISPTMTLFCVGILPIGFILIIIIVKNSQKYFIQQQEYLGHINSQVEEMYGGHNVVKVFNGDGKAIQKFSKTNEVLYSAGWKSQFLSGMMGPIMQFIGNLGYVAVSILGGYLTIQGKLEVGYILSFSQYIRSFNQPMSQIAQIMNLLQSTAAAAERIFEFLEEEEEDQTISNPVSTKGIKGNIEFDNVSFGYDSNKIVIHNFNAKVKQGQKIAIVGPTGAGKTTMVKLLMRFYDVNSGGILIDGHNIKDFDRNELRNLFGMVLQDTWLFTGSIKNNIRYGKLDATDNEVINAAKASYIDHFIRTLPDSYNMIIDEESTNISAGQKQLLTIARVILADPTILILDEATSSVDTRTEILIQKAMDKLMQGRTSFVIAHRLSTIKNADLIFVMDKGNIVEVGKHEELLKKQGFYANIYNSQFEK